MKIKAKKHVDSSDSYHGIKNMDDWYNLNAGKVVEMKEVPESLKDYVEIVKENKQNGSRR